MQTSLDPEDNFGAPPSPRRNPSQKRSRERQERILGVATRLIASKGSDQLKMSEIASLCEISIGSLYQYFPDKSSIILSLAQRYNAESRRCIQVALEKVHDAQSLEVAYSELLDLYYQVITAEPVMRDIWSGMQADKQLLELELQESRIAAQMLTRAVLRAFPDANEKEVSDAAFLVWQLGESTMRLAISCSEAEGKRLVETFKRMSLREILHPALADSLNSPI
ncbi:TetR family transcriptional regulator [Pseudomonas sp. MWU12-2029]|uniref:TetR family transcriptional regulator n=1 Tax=Pseudomonas sp. MWU12-2029 TaxID=2927805 RepID=UPI00200ED4AA|nr:TetR/AcrR family transcriptional regulator [Pseudomonas sp. MWU12-2029]